VFRCTIMTDICILISPGVGSGLTVFDDMTPVAGIDYYYAVSAQNDSGFSDTSELILGRARAPDSTPAPTPDPSPGPPGSPALGPSPCGAFGMVGLILLIGSSVGIKLVPTRWRSRWSRLRRPKSSADALIHRSP
jgi:hypothetical protein